jgi:hypothetical protein
LIAFLNMSFWTLVKMIAAICVAGVMVFTGMLAWHVSVSPLGGPFARLIPSRLSNNDGRSELEFVKMLESADLPDVDPGEKAFQKAHELLALGKLDEAREKLNSIITLYPASASAPMARRIVGEMNLDDILSSAHMAGKQNYVVKRGDSYLAIAARHQTSIDCIMHFNSMMELRSIQPGDELILLPLHFRILIEPQRNTVTLMEGDRFVREYQALHLASIPPGTHKTTIKSKGAELDGRSVKAETKDYRAANKSITLAKPALQFRGWDGNGDRPSGGILLRPQDIEEICLLTRPGNEVEIR